MTQARGSRMTSRMAVFAVVTVAGVLTTLVAYFVFGSGDDAADVAAGPFWPPLFGIFMTLFGAVGLAHAWWLKRQGKGEGSFSVDHDDTGV